MSFAKKPEGAAVDTPFHKIRISLTSRNPKNLEKGMLHIRFVFFSSYFSLRRSYPWRH